MSTHDDERIQTDALGSSAPMSSADRARFWAGLNRYLETEAELAEWRPVHARVCSAGRAPEGQE